MKDILLSACIFLYLPVVQSQVHFDKFENVISEAQRVVDSFIHYHSTEVSEKLNEPKWKLVDKEGFIEMKTTFILKKPVFKIKDFRSLNQQENRLFTLLNKKHGHGEETIDFYYSLIVYWLLPHRLHHLLEIPFDKEDFKSRSKFVVNYETLVDKRTILFMIKSSFHEKIPNFISMLDDIIEYTKPEDLAYLHEIYEKPFPMNTLAKHLFVDARTMQIAIMELRSKDHEMNSTSKESYDEEKYMSEADSILMNFKNIFHKDDNDLWVVKFKNMYYDHDPVLYNINPNAKVLRIKSFESLSGSEEAFILDLKNTYGYDGKTVDFYYLIINYWLLPEDLMELTLTQNNKTQLNDFGLELHRMTLTHMALEGYLKKFRDFNKLCKVIIMLTEKKRSLDQLNEWKESRNDVENIQYGLYKNALEMDKAINSLNVNEQ